MNEAKSIVNVPDSNKDMIAVWVIVMMVLLMQHLYANFDMMLMTSLHLVLLAHLPIPMLLLIVQTDVSVHSNG
jgi:hypothetical protein